GRAPPRSAADARAIAAEYLQLGLVCPFLDDDACSVHEHRPFVCRQYLVTSPAEACTDPLARPVAVVQLPIRPAHALLEATRNCDEAPPRTLPLVLARVHADTAPAAPRQDAARTFTRWLSALAGGRAGDPPIR
ncbi:MAG: YkgJ family cysteine cluster protein, partial [Rhodoferax sp.]|nr:YkgJ family cysteine cluster protein [Rhodoferax sp.]